MIDGWKVFVMYCYCPSFQDGGYGLRIFGANETSWEAFSNDDGTIKLKLTSFTSGTFNQTAFS